MIILSGYPRSVFQDFERYLRTEVDLVEDDIKLVLDEYISSFITYDLEPGIYSLKDISEDLFKILQPEYDGYHDVIDIEYDGITMKTKLFVGTSIAIKFDEQSFFISILGFTPGWDYKPYNEHMGQKIINLSTTNKIHLKCDCIDGSVIDGLRQPNL